ncbi:aspartate kinase [Vulgatibacter sp.]|uniref:aspartate kinase n=1 Tax=Vulgatibacter sp. TaxID=1971226 RepID=UPI003567CC77
MSIVVQKYGGSSVADVEKIRKVADRVAATQAAGKQVVVVVSAMGDTTDELLALARQVCESPARRELDMLLTAGERISMALLSMALNARNVPAVSFTGSQSGIITNDSHANARIVEVRPYRVQDELERGKVVIVAGYQGVSYKKEVTTLGRGGSDTTAVALAAALGAEACEIYSDVEGVYSADPRVVPESRRLSEVSYEEMQELAEAGAKVLNAQAVEFAKDKGIAIFARSTFGGSGETVVRKLAPGAPGRVVGVTSEKELALLDAKPESSTALAELLEHLDARAAGGKQLLFERASSAGTGATSLLLSLENLHDFGALKQDLAVRFGGEVQVREGIGAVSAIGSGINATFANVRRALAALAAAQIEVLALSTSSFRISVLVEERHLAEAVRRLHAELITV